MRRQRSAAPVLLAVGDCRVFLPIFALELKKNACYTGKPRPFVLFATRFRDLALMRSAYRGRITEKRTVELAGGTRIGPSSRALRVRWLTLGLAVVIVGFTAPIFSRLGAEFMPPLNEGTILYMPTTVPGLSIPASAKVLQVQDQLLTTFPEVERVFGKMGKAPTATDPAFVGMAEITVTLKPEAQWRPGMTWDRLLDEMDAKLRIPGFPNIWWMPIRRARDIRPACSPSVSKSWAGSEAIEKSVRDRASWPRCQARKARCRG